MSPEHHSLETSVRVRNAYKTYGRGKKSNAVLCGLNMTVYAGKIYALLGASGCGKTTLLSCLIGRKHLDKGNINVGVGGKLVGYVPQETALWLELTIKETMLYFGWLYGMRREEIKRRLDFLLNFLNLPEPRMRIKHLSGGQQRRVSLAVAFLHDPELLILDEPTVGVDPILRQAIWKHMNDICNNRTKTIIITTHYIEEARQAQWVGMMRGGRLLVEESPQKLLQQFNTSSLEQVFLQLSQQQQQQPVENCQDSLQLEEENENVMSRSSSFTWSKMRALLFKNILGLWRSSALILFIFLLPIVQSLFFCTAIGHDPQGLRVAVFSDEINMNVEECNVVDGCQFIRLSCRFLSHFDPDKIHVVFYSDLEMALNAVRDGDAWTALHFHRGFSQAISKRVLGKNVSDQILDDSEIKIHMDFSNYQIALSLQYHLQQTYGTFLREIAKDCNLNPHRAQSPLFFREALVGSANPTFINFMAPGIILTMIFFLEVGLTSLTLISERTQGLLDRSWIAGVSPIELILSHILVHLLIIMIQTSIVIVIMLTLFDVEFSGFMGWIFALAFLQGVCGMCYGLLISALCAVERDAIQLAIGSFYPNLLLSGVVWPIEGMSLFLRPIAVFLPLTLATNAMRNLMTRGWSIWHPQVYYGFISTILWIGVFFILSLVFIKLKQFK